MKQLPKGANRLMKLALGPKAYLLIQVINLWLKESGPEWTVARLKAIRSGAYQLRAGNSDLAREIWQSNSISYYHNTLIPKGIVGYIVLNYVKAERPKIIRKYDAALRVYTCIRMSKLTHTQYLKAKKAINDPFQGNPEFLEKLSNKFREWLFYGHKALRAKNLTTLSNPDFKIRVDMSRMSKSSATHSELLNGTDLRSQPWGRHVMSLWTSTYLPEVLWPYVGPSILYRELRASGADTEIAGHIAFLQEGGCKARVVAVPNVWIQLHMMQLEDYLDKLIKRLPESCSHEQNKGAYFMKENLQAGNKLYCYDLSSATDRFPLVLQQQVLESLGFDMYSDAIEQIAKAKWKVKTQFGEEVWSYQTGQPMGMYSSFKLFHLTHILLLKYIEYVAKCKDTFRVLGDDVIISNDKVASYYSEILTSLGMEISKTKSIISDRFGEFAGFVSNKARHGVAIHRPFKYSGAHGFGAAIPLLYSFGASCRQISPWFSDKYTMFRHTMSWRNPDLTPLLHQDDGPVGGAVLNSHLLGSMSNRLSYSLDYWPSETLLESYERQQIILLGEKEKCDPNEGFASANANANLSMGRDINHDLLAPSNVWSQQVSSDPLMRDQINRQQESNCLNNVK